MNEKLNTFYQFVSERFLYLQDSYLIVLYRMKQSKNKEQQRLFSMIYCPIYQIQQPERPRYHYL